MHLVHVHDVFAPTSPRDEGATRPVLGGRALPKRPPRAHFIKGEAVFAGRGADVCELVIALGGDAFDGTTGTIKGARS